jgi:hypothetical protein
LSTTNPTQTNPGLNPGFRGGRPATNRLSHGTALMHGGYLQSPICLQDAYFVISIIIFIIIIIIYNRHLCC